MKEAEIGAAVLAGQKLAVGDFRDWEIKENPDKRNPGQYNVIEQCFVLVGREVVSVDRFAEKGKRKTDITRPPFKSGDRVVIEFKSWEHTKWGTRVSGNVQPLLK